MCGYADEVCVIFRVYVKRGLFNGPGNGLI